jgi:hypothetical protein
VRLYHFTGLWPLVGTTGLAALKADHTRDPLVVAESGAILKAGLRPQSDRLQDGKVPPCIWLTTDANMPLGFSSNSDFRIEVVIPDSDRRLMQYAAYLRKQQSKAEGIFKAEVVRHEGRIRLEDWWLYFGRVEPRRFRSIEHVKEREEDRRHYAAITRETAMRKAA